VSITMARAVAIAVVRVSARSEKGLRRKWGSRYSPGAMRKAGKVMRVKVPKVRREPRRAEDTIEERC